MGVALPRQAWNYDTTRNLTDSGVSASAFHIVGWPCCRLAGHPTVLRRLLADVQSRERDTCPRSARPPGAKRHENGNGRLTFKRDALLTKTGLGQTKERVQQPPALHRIPQKLTAAGPLTEDGVQHEVDVVVFATGFDAWTGSFRGKHAATQSRTSSRNLARNHAAATNRLGLLVCMSVGFDVIGRDGVNIVDYWSAGPRTFAGAAHKQAPVCPLSLGPMIALLP